MSITTITQAGTTYGGGSTCSICGEWIFPSNLPHHCPNPAKKGWECPRCGKINSPYVSTCACYVSTYQYPPSSGYVQPCLIEEFFRNNPGGTCCVSCPCPRCTPYCLSVKRKEI